MDWNWVVSFNDGQRIAASNLLQNNSKENPWEYVLGYLKKNPTNVNGGDKKITHIELIVRGARYNSPSNSKSSLFYSEEVKNFWIFYKSLGNLNDSSNEEYVAYSYRLGDYRHFFWVNTSNNNCYAQILNVKNPQTNTEKDFAMIESEIEESFSIS